MYFISYFQTICCDDARLFVRENSGGAFIVTAMGFSHPGFNTLQSSENYIYFEWHGGSGASNGGWQVRLSLSGHLPRRRQKQQHFFNQRTVTQLTQAGTIKKSIKYTISPTCVPKRAMDEISSSLEVDNRNMLRNFFFLWALKYIEEDHFDWPNFFLPFADHLGGVLSWCKRLEK